MSNKNVTLTDSSNNELYPATLSSNVYRPDNTTVEQALLNIYSIVSTETIFNTTISSATSNLSLLNGRNFSDYQMIGFGVKDAYGNLSYTYFPSFECTSGTPLLVTIANGGSTSWGCQLTFNSGNTFNVTSLTGCSLARIVGVTGASSTVETALGYQKHFQAFGGLKTATTHYGNVYYDRLSAKSGLLTISFRVDTNSSSDFIMVNFSRINALLGLTLKKPNNLSRGGIWTATNFANESSQGYGSCCEINDNYITVARTYTTSGSVGGWACSNFYGQVVNIYNLYVEEA